MPEDFEKWITTAEAGELSGYNVYHVRRLAVQGKIEAKKQGRDWFLSKSSLLEYVERMQALGPAKHDPWRTGARQHDEDEAEAGD